MVKKAPECSRKLVRINFKRFGKTSSNPTDEANPRHLLAQGFKILVPHEPPHMAITQDPALLHGALTN